MRVILIVQMAFLLAHKSYSDYVASGSDDNTIGIWDMTRRVLVQKLTGHTGHILHLKSLEQNYLASTSSKDDLKIWDLTNGACLHTVNFQNKILSLEIVQPGSLLAISTSDHKITIYNYKNGTLVRTLWGYEDATALLYVNDTFLVSGGTKLAMWNYGNGYIAFQLNGHVNKNIQKILRIDNDTVATYAQNDNVVRVWNLTRRVELKNLSHSIAVFTIFLMKPNYLVSVDSRIKLWNLNNYSLNLEIGDTDSLYPLVELKSTSKFACRGTNFKVKIWHKNQNVLHKVLNEPRGNILSLLELSDGHLVTSDSKNNILMWNTTFDFVQTLVGHYSSVTILEKLSILDISESNFTDYTSSIPFTSSNFDNITQSTGLFSDLTMEEISNMLSSTYDITPCLLNCSNHGQCVQNGDFFVCSCFENYSGQRCEADLRLCSSQPCINNATCVDYIEFETYLFNCTCPKFYYGTYCQFKEDVCKNVNCSSNGICQDIQNKPVCKCFDMVSGSQCETQSMRLKIIKAVVSTSTILAIVIILMCYLLFILFDLCSFFSSANQSQLKKKRNSEKMQIRKQVKHTVKYINK